MSLLLCRVRLRRWEGHNKRLLPAHRVCSEIFHIPGLR